MDGKRRDWSKAPVVFITRPCCPHCQHEKYDRSWTESNGDGSVTKFCVCRGCGEQYKISDFPVSGNDVMWPV